jgi:hypothetical protein
VLVESGWPVWLVWWLQLEPELLWQLGWWQCQLKSGVTVTTVGLPDSVKYSENHKTDGTHWITIKHNMSYVLQQTSCNTHNSWGLTTLKELHKWSLTLSYILFISTLTPTNYRLFCEKIKGTRSSQMNCLLSFHYNCVSDTTSRKNTVACICTHNEVNKKQRTICWYYRMGNHAESYSMVCTKFHDDQFRHWSNIIKVIITSTISEAAVFVLLMVGVYDVCHWDVVRCQDAHTKFLWRPVQTFKSC